MTAARTPRTEKGRGELRTSPWPSRRGLGAAAAAATTKREGAKGVAG